MAKQYAFNCPIARTLDVMGDRWTMLILRDLFKLGPLRFQHFVDVLPGLAPTTLSARLKGLEENGILERQLYSDHPPRAEYALSQKGRKLGPVLKAMENWGREFDAGAG